MDRIRFFAEECDRMQVGFPGQASLAPSTGNGPSVGSTAGRA